MCLDLALVRRLAFGAATSAGFGLARLARGNCIAPRSIRLVAGGNILFALRQAARLFLGIGSDLRLARGQLFALDLAFHLLGATFQRLIRLASP